jgi:hypothetical protein
MREAQASAHHEARTNDEKQKERMRAEYDLRMHTRKSGLQVGSLVVAQRPITNKSVTPWDPNPYRVISIKGSMVTAQRPGHIITRNSSLFKRYTTDSDDDEPDQRPAVHNATRHDTGGGSSESATSATASEVGPKEETRTTQMRDNSIEQDPTSSPEHCPSSGAGYGQTSSKKLTKATKATKNAAGDNSIEQDPTPSPEHCPSSGAGYGQTSRKKLTKATKATKNAAEALRRAQRPPERQSDRLRLQRESGGRM